MIAQRPAANPGAELAASMGSTRMETLSSVAAASWCSQSGPDINAEQKQFEQQQLQMQQQQMQQQMQMGGGSGGFNVGQGCCHGGRGGGMPGSAMGGSFGPGQMGGGVQGNQSGPQGGGNIGLYVHAPIASLPERLRWRHPLSPAPQHSSLSPRPPLALQGPGRAPAGPWQRPRFATMLPHTTPPCSFFPTLITSSTGFAEATR